MIKTARPLSPLYALACSALLTWASATQAARTPQPSAPSLMPLPAKIETQAGHYQPKASVRIALEGDARELEALAALASDIVQATWRTPPEMAADGTRADLVLRLAPGTTTTSPESYTLRVDAQGIRLQAASAAGLFYGLQTLRQLLEQSGGEGIGFVSIEDAPRFAWRGLHLDVGRHLFPVEYIKRQLDLMARYKFNTLHLHFTEDHGCRLKFNIYPKLTAV